MSSGGFTAAYQDLMPAFANDYEVDVNTVYGASMGGAPSSIPERLNRNERADAVILASQGLERLIEEGKVVSGSRVDLAASLIGMAVREGDSIPDIGTTQAFLEVLADASSIAYSASASGTYLSTELFPRLDIADQLKNKCIRVVGERVGLVVARGEAEIGFQQVSELLPIKGITYVGTIPESMQLVTTFSAGITTNAENIEMAKSLLGYLSSAEVSQVIRKTGMKPMNQ